MAVDPRSVVLVVAAAAAGCGGSGGSNGDGAPATLPVCAKPAKTIARPAELPAGLPTPRGTVFTKVEHPFAGQTVVSGVSPGDPADTNAFYGDELEKAGFQAGRGESEPGEFEALFTGKGVRGGWRANVIQDCPDASLLTLVVIET